MAWKTLKEGAVVFALVASGPGCADDGLCEGGDEDITLASLQDLELVEDVECSVGVDGFDCDSFTIDAAALFDPFGPVPWTQGDTVRVTVNPQFYGNAELVVRGADDALLAVYADARPPGTVAPLQIDVAPVPAECGENGSGGINLRTTYSIGDERLTLTGASSGRVAGFRVFQESAEDITESSAGEIAEMISFVAVAETSG